MSTTKTCSKCGETKSLDEFYKQVRGKHGKRSICKGCANKQEKKYRKEHKEEIRENDKKYYQDHKEERKKISKRYRESHVDEIRKRKGVNPMDQNKSCPQYLGIVVAERLCRHLFNDVVMMPYGFPDYDMICNRGKKINVKAACITFAKNGKNPHFQFRIKRNKITDFFICVAFDNVEDLNPLHMWMIPGSEINDKTKTTISPSTLHKWNKWKRDINDAQLCCAEIKESEHTSKNLKTGI